MNFQLLILLGLGLTFPTAIDRAMKRAGVAGGRRMIPAWIVGATFPLWFMAVSIGIGKLIAPASNAPAGFGPGLMPAIIVGSALSWIAIAHATGSRRAAVGAIWGAIAAIFIGAVELVFTRQLAGGMIFRAVLLSLVLVIVWRSLVGLGLARWSKQARASRNDSLCAKCAYDLTGLPAGTLCPECGAPTHGRYCEVKNNDD